MWKNLRSYLSKRITLLYVPHKAAPTRRIVLPVGGIAAMATLWIGLAAWAFLILSRHANYMATLEANRFLSEKNGLFAQELLRSRQIAGELKELDTELRQMIGLKDKKTIIESLGRGGPSPLDTSLLGRQLGGRLADMTPEDLLAASRQFSREAEDIKASWQEIQSFLAGQRRLLSATPSIWPATGHLTSHFGYRLSPFTQVSDFHQAIDIANERGTPIRATAGGTVMFAGWMGGYGRLVMLNHGYGYSTRYGHCSRILVQPGQRVARGEVVAYMGSSGSSTGDHVHYEVWSKGKPYNPLRYIDR